MEVHHEPSNQDCHGSLRNTVHESAVSSKLSSVSLCFWCLTIVELAESSMCCLMSLRSVFFFIGRTVRAGYRRYCPSRICGIHLYRILSYPIPFPRVLVHSSPTTSAFCSGVLKSVDQSNAIHLRSSFAAPRYDDPRHGKFHFDNRPRMGSVLWLRAFT